MKGILVIVVALAVMGAYALSLCRAAAQSQPASSAATKTAAKNASPFFCNRTALTAEQRHRQQELGKTLRSSLLGVQELPDGYEFEFAPGRPNYDALTEFTPMEHTCCPFFDVSIRLERESGKLWWRLTGREGVKPFIRAEFGPWFGGGAI
ncbi:MAG TPA: hypothetical protein VH724_15265 [Candidatus Angelobacter sp.]|jgi:hypothetical protein|nr:hypothetical protein [Candidatus Angelobacter sp.]